MTGQVNYRNVELVLQSRILFYPDPVVPARPVNKEECLFLLRKVLAAHPAGYLRTADFMKYYHGTIVLLTRESGGR